MIAIHGETPSAWNTPANGPVAPRRYPADDQAAAGSPSAPHAGREQLEVAFVEKMPADQRAQQHEADAA